MTAPPDNGAQREAAGDDDAPHVFDPQALELLAEATTKLAASGDRPGERQARRQGRRETLGGGRWLWCGGGVHIVVV